LVTIVENLQIGILNPYPILVKYLSFLHPESERFLCKPCNSVVRLAEYKDKYSEKDVLFYPSVISMPNYNIGRNKVTAYQKKIAQRCGAPNWNQCTGQGLRKLAITIAVDSGMHPVDIAAIARHSSLNSQQSYIKDSNKRKGLRAVAIQQKPAQRMDLKPTPEKMKRRPFLKKNKNVGPLVAQGVDYDINRRDLVIPVQPAMQSLLLNEEDVGPIMPGLHDFQAPSVVRSNEFVSVPAPSPSPFLLSNLERQELEWLRQQHVVTNPQVTLPNTYPPAPQHLPPPRTYLQAAIAPAARHRVMYDQNTGAPYIADEYGRPIGNYTTHLPPQALPMPPPMAYTTQAMAPPPPRPYYQQQDPYAASFQQHGRYI
jgi:hypothetical protein